MVSIDTNKKIENNDKFVRYFIKGDPVALQRFRLGHGHIFDGQKSEKVIHGIDLQYQHDDRPFYEGPLKLVIEFHFKKTKSNKKSVTGDWFFYRPDLSNLIKYVEDVANNILYHDDCLIAQIYAKKIYSDEPHTEFYIEELNEKSK